MCILKACWVSGGLSPFTVNSINNQIPDKMNLEQFVKDCLSGKGASYNVTTGDYNPRAGYMVSVKGYERVLDHPDRDQIIQYVKDKSEECAKDEALYYGGWRPDRLYLDLSKRYGSLSEAMKAGQEAGQLEIWDCANAVGIPVYQREII